jgi:SAM-dependent methyltransferase
MLAAVFDQAAVIGIDSSPAFVEEATAAASARCRYQVADVTGGALPGGPVDVIYARFLVVHLPEPHRALAQWAQQLAPGGVLVVEEPERIETEDADFTRYLELAAVVVEARGGDLYAGRLLTTAVPPVVDAELVFVRCTSLDVPAGRAATIFSLNLDTWRDDPAVTAVIGPGEVAALADRLEGRRSDVSTGAIRWWMTQLVVRR